MGSSSFAVANVRELDSEDRGQLSAERRLNTALATLDRRLEHLRGGSRLVQGGLLVYLGKWDPWNQWILLSPCQAWSSSLQPLVLTKLMVPEGDLSLNQMFFCPSSFPGISDELRLCVFLPRKLFTFWILHNFETVCGFSTIVVHRGTTRDLSVLKMSVIFARQLGLKTIFFFCYVMRRFLKLKKIFIVLF